MVYVGIDLGTTNSCIAAVDRTGRVEALTNDQGSRLTPSCVAFADDERWIGSEARILRKSYPESTVFAVKRIIGRNFAERTVQEDRRNWPFEVFDDNDRPKIRVRTKRETMSFYPKEISGMVLEKLKTIAEEKRGDVNSAVVTVPAYFNGAQRRATKEAAKLAELSVECTINEPTAAAIAYAFQNKIRSKRTMMVYDLGGGTFDVSLLTIEGAAFEVIATGGDTHLGGDDFTQNIVAYLVEEFESQYGEGIRTDKRAMVRLFDQSEEAKKNLTVGYEQRIDMDALHNRRDLNVIFNRAKFENLNIPLFRKTFHIVEGVLADSRTRKPQIDDVLLVGGSSRIPFIRQKLTEMFGRDKIRTAIEPDEAVAYGAGVYAAKLSGQMIPRISDLQLHDVTPLSLGIKVKGGITSVIMERNTRIPATRQCQYYTVADNQTRMKISVYEGERARIDENLLLGGFLLEGIPPMPAGQAKVMVKFDRDINGLLDVNAWETTTGNAGKIVVNTDRQRNSDADITRMIAAAKKWRDHDDEHRRKVQARNSLEARILEIRRLRSSREITRKCDEIRQWLQNNTGATREQIVAKHRELEECVSRH